MPRARRKPSAPPQITDTGPDTPAQREGATYAQTKDGRPGEVRKTRQHPLERMETRGALTFEEKERGMMAVKLFEATHKGGPMLREFVDGRADPDLPAVLRCDAHFAYARAVVDIPPRCRRAYDHVVEDGRYLISLRGCRTSHTERKRQWKLLRKALAALNV